MIIIVMGNHRQTLGSAQPPGPSFPIAPWSIPEQGTFHYAFIWAMGGGNQILPDMDFVAMKELNIINM